LCLASGEVGETCCDAKPTATKHVATLEVAAIKASAPMASKAAPDCGPSKAAAVGWKGARLLKISTGTKRPMGAEPSQAETAKQLKVTKALSSVHGTGDEQVELCLCWDVGHYLAQLDLRQNHGRQHLGLSFCKKEWIRLRMKLGFAQRPQVAGGRSGGLPLA
jgi:hypothetical protein